MLCRRLVCILAASVVLVLVGAAAAHGLEAETLPLPDSTAMEESLEVGETLEDIPREETSGDDETDELKGGAMEGTTPVGAAVSEQEVRVPPETGDTTGAAVPSYRLAEIVVWAARLPAIGPGIPADVTVLERSAIEENSERNLLTLLNKQVGINAGSYGSFGALELISMRGGRSGRVPTLIDGVMINNAQNGAMDFNSIPASLIEKVQILRGPLGLVHGGNGISGIVNFVTTGPEPGHKPLSVVGVSSGSLAYRKVIGTFARQLGQTGMFLGMEDASSNGVEPYKDYSGKNYFGKLQHRFGRGTGLGFLIMAHDGLLRSLNEAEQKTKVTRMQLSTDTRIGERNEAQLAVFRSSELTKYEEPFLKTRSDLDRYGGLLDLSLPGTPAGDVTCGGGFVKDELSCEDAVSSWSPAMGAGYLFACSSFKTGGWLNSLVSLRGDFHSDYGNELSPCGSLWHERGQTVLWFSFGRGFNPPTMNDLFWPEQTSSWEDTSGVKWTFVTKGNDRLKPESSWMGELGSRFSLLGGAIRGSATCYASRTEDFIEWGFSVNTSDSTVTYCEPVNVEQVDALGAELTLDFARGGESLARLNVSLQNVEDQDGVAVPYMPRSRCNLWLARSIEPFPELTMTLSVDATYLGECTEPGNSRQGPFFLVEQKLSGSIAGFTAFVRLRNVTDEVYPSRYPKPGEPGVYFPMPGRTYEIGFLWKLVD